MDSLYEKIGGEPTIEKLVTAFYQHVLADAELGPFFKDSSVEKLQRMQQAFFTVALGGPEPPLRLSLYEAHRDRGITSRHLTKFTEHLVSTLQEIGVSEENTKEIYQRIAVYSNEILGDSNIDG